VSMLAVQPRLQGAHSEVPKDFAERLAALSTTILRKTDLLSRLRGGTTIHILLVGAPLEALAGIIQRIAAELEAHRLVVDGVERGVRLGIGGACCPTPAPATADLV